MNLKLQNAAPARGARWVRQGFGVFFKRPVACSALFAGFIFALLMLLLVPWIGSLLVMMALTKGQKISPTMITTIGSTKM